MNYINSYLSPLGPITMSSDGTALTGLWFDGQKYFWRHNNKKKPLSQRCCLSLSTPEPGLIYTLTEIIRTLYLRSN